jgi:LysM repeat protein
VNANLYTVSIALTEMTLGSPTREQLNAGAWLIRQVNNQLQTLYGTTIPIRRDRVVGHGEITPVTKPNCPGRVFPFDELIRLANGGATSATIPPPTSPPLGMTYTVIKGDRGRAIAQQFGITLAQLQAANPQIRDIDRLSVGQRLNVPVQTTYTVVKGDRGRTIAQRFGITLAQLQAANPQIRDIDKLSVGQRLSIPSIR